MLDLFKAGLEVTKFTLDYFLGLGSWTWCHQYKGGRRVVYVFDKDKGRVPRMSTSSRGKYRTKLDYVLPPDGVRELNAVPEGGVSPLRLERPGSGMSGPVTICRGVSYSIN